MSLLEKNSGLFSRFIQQKVIEPSEIRDKAKDLKSKGKTIVTINGSFDLLHPGHYEMLYEASLQGDCLLVLLNSDESIRQYKSPHRPIHPLEERIQQIAALEMVDFVSYFEETDPCKILEQIQPDVHVNGSEYGENCIEAEVVKLCGGKIHIVSLMKGFSTTNIIEKIKKICV